MFQVEVTTTISYLSIQNFPLRFCIHISPLWWSNPGNSLGAVIGDEIKNRKKKIWKKKSVIRFICEADANIMFLIISLKMKTTNHTMIAHTRTYLQNCQKSSCLTEKGKRLIKKNIPASFPVLKPQSHDAFYNRCCSLNEVASAFFYGAKIIIVTRALPLQSCLFHKAWRSPLVR